jgi:hypothetical protein
MLTGRWCLGDFKRVNISPGVRWLPVSREDGKEKRETNTYRLPVFPAILQNLLLGKCQIVLQLAA